MSSVPNIVDVVVKRNRLQHCPVCGVWLANSRFMQQHIAQQHIFKPTIEALIARLKDIPGPKQCEHCGVRHERGPVQCPVFLTAALLKHHHCIPPQDDGTGSRQEGDGSVDENAGRPPSHRTDGSGTLQTRKGRPRDGGTYSQWGPTQKDTAQRGQRQRSTAQGNDQRPSSHEPGGSQGSRPDGCHPDAHSAGSAPGRPAASAATGPCLRAVPRSAVQSHDLASTVRARPNVELQQDPGLRLRAFLYG